MVTLTFVSSAIKIYPDECNGNPMIICGKRHCDCFATVAKLDLHRNKNLDIQGFMLSDWRFVDRKEAASIAIKLGYSPKHSDCLYSEDLW